MISGISELRAAKAVVDEVRTELTAEGIAFDTFDPATLDLIAGWLVDRAKK